MLNNRMILNDDGDAICNQITANLEESVDRIVEQCPEFITTYMLDPFRMLHRIITDIRSTPSSSLSTKSTKTNETFRFDLMLRKLRKKGKEVFISFRVNDVHNADDLSAPLTWVSEFRRNNPDCIVEPNAVNTKKKEWMNFCLDYSRPPVQEHMLLIIKDLLGRFREIDGLELDWMRFPRHLSGTPEQVWVKRRILTDLLASIRHLLHEIRGKDALLSVRIPSNLAGCHHVGLDVETWAKQGLVDFMVPSPFLTTEFTMPISEFRHVCGDNIPLYACTEFNYGFGRYHCPESIRGAVSSLYESGCDGIYLFNWPCWTEYVSAIPYHWLTGLRYPIDAVAKPIQLSLPHQFFRVPGVDLPATLPVSVKPDHEHVFEVVIPKSAFPISRARLLVRSEGNILLSIDDTSLELMPGIHCSELFPEYIDHEWLSDKRAQKKDCRLFEVPSKLLHPGCNFLTVRNTSQTPITVQTMDIGIW